MPAPTVFDAAKPELLSSITRPTLLLDEARARANIRRMAARARSQGIRFRPHFKTHQSAAVGEWFRAEGVECITVSSVAMARYFADAGWRDITIAFPVNLRELPAIDRLAADVTLHLLAESPEAVDALAARLAHPVDLWIEADTGYNRSGVAAGDSARLVAVAQRAAAAGKLRLRGLLTHTGHSYALSGRAALEELHAATLAALLDARTALAAAGFPGLELSIGDTPICSVVEHLGAVDEIRPGNFVFFDLTQAAIGACAEENIAVAVACPVVAKYPARREIALYGGAVHLSKDFLRRNDGTLEFGRAAFLHDPAGSAAGAGWGPSIPGAWLRSLSQEHGIVRADAAAYARLDALQVGDLLAVLPVHSCLTADLLKHYLTLDGRGLAAMPLPPPSPPPAPERQL